jgi:hypothetical protein
MFKDYRALTLTAILLISIAMPAGAALLSQSQAENQARGFLKQLDQGQNDESWQAMSALFQAINDQARWKIRQQVIRASYGSLLSRDLKNVSYRTSFSLSPDGQYVITQFRSSYQNKAESVETVVLDCSSGPKCSVREYVLQ